MNRVVRSHLLIDGISENRADEPHCPGSSALAAADARQSTRLRLDLGRSLAFGDSMHEAFYVVAGDGANGQSSEQWLYVARDPPPISGKRASLLWHPTPGQ